MPTPGPDQRPLSSLPSTRARAIAFAAIVLAGLCGALIGYFVVDVQCTGGCGAASGIGAIVGGAMIAGGVAVVAVLTLRAMTEWRKINEADLLGEPGDQPPSTRRRKPSA